MTADRVGGVWTYATELAAALAPLGVETVVTVMGPRSGRPEPVERPPSSPTKGTARTETGVEVIDTHLPLDWLCTAAAPVRDAAVALAGLARDIGADVVQLNSPALAAPSITGATRWPVPVVAVEHGSVAPWWEAAHPGEPLPTGFAWHETMMRDGLIAADATVAPSASHAATVQRRYRLPRLPLAIHNGRTPAPASPFAAPARHAFTAGRLWDRVKRTPLLDRIAALTPIRAAGPITAPHGETAACDHLHLLGTLDAAALAAEFAARPVFVSAACFEPFGLAVLEAAQAGCPLVLADIATFRELWDGAAIFVAGEEPADWSAAIARAAADRDAMGEAARTRSARYTPHATATAMTAVYRDLLARRSVAA